MAHVARPVSPPKEGAGEDEAMSSKAGLKPFGPLKNHAFGETWPPGADGSILEPGPYKASLGRQEVRDRASHECSKAMATRTVSSGNVEN